MPCYHPKKGFPIGITENGKTKYKVVPWLTDHVERVPEGFVPVSCPTVSLRAAYAVRDYVPIPCGRCLGCRLDYAKQWSARLQCEYQCHDPETCWFLTLTYDDEHLPLTIGTDSMDQAGLVGDLDPDGVTKFIKRLRRHFEPAKLRYFLSGEYGTSTQRPHYHMIVYGLPLKSNHLLEYEVSDLGDRTWKCPILDRIWNQGFVVVGKVTLESCAYVARYCLKKLHDQEDYSWRHPEFVRMSRNPGLGKAWLDAHPEIFEVSMFSLPSKNGAQQFMHPRYFLKQLQQSDPDRYDAIKAERKLAGELSFQNLHLDDFQYLQYLSRKESVMISKTKKLIRKV